MKHDERAFRKGQSNSESNATSFMQRLEAARFVNVINFLLQDLKLSFYDFSSDSDKREDTKELETKDVKSKEAQEKQST
jgi:hypothetical protein